MARPNKTATSVAVSLGRAIAPARVCFLEEGPPGGRNQPPSVRATSPAAKSTSTARSNRCGTRGVALIWPPAGHKHSVITPFVAFGARLKTQTAEGKPTPRHRLPVKTIQKRNRSDPEATNTVLRSGSSEMLWPCTTVSSSKVRIATAPGGTLHAPGAPFAASSCDRPGICQTRTVLSALPEATNRPSGEKVTGRTGPVWPSKRWTSRPDSMPHKRTVLSAPPETNSELSGEQSTPQGRAV